jgi:hypothetical protein
MSSTAVYRGRLADGIDLGQVARDAVELANAAHEVARSTPAAVRALAAERFANAQAAAGNTRSGTVAACSTARRQFSVARLPPGSPRCAGCLPSAPAAGRWSCAGCRGWCQDDTVSRGDDQVEVGRAD